MTLNTLNLNDPQWGRNDDSSAGDAQGHKPAADDASPKPNADVPGRKNTPPAGPPDLDELWKDFSQKLNQIFGGAAKPGRGGGLEPDAKGTQIGVGLIAGAILLMWLATGFFIVQEGEHAVVTQFGKHRTTVKVAGINWRLPFPIERHEVVAVSQIRSVDIGGDNIISATGLRESAMLTEDENILDVKFAVQYRLSDARAYLFESQNPQGAVVQAAETAIREVIGKMKMNAALSEERDQIAPRVRVLMQRILDHYNVGIEVVGINWQQGGIRPPEQVQAAFDDVLKAGQERERAKNEAQAYANDVIPRAVGSASRLKEEADAYKAKVVAQAQGDAQRFRSIYAEYKKAPQVMRDRMYLDTMQQIYSSVTKVVVESRQGATLLNLPLEKLLQTTVAGAAIGEAPAAPAPMTAPSGTAPTGLEQRSRDALRTRDRDTR